MGGVNAQRLDKSIVDFDVDKCLNLSEQNCLNLSERYSLDPKCLCYVNYVLVHSILCYEWGGVFFLFQRVRL